VCVANVLKGKRKGQSRNSGGGGAAFRREETRALRLSTANKETQGFGFKGNCETSMQKRVSQDVTQHITIDKRKRRKDVTRKGSPYLHWSYERRGEITREQALEHWARTVRGRHYSEVEESAENSIGRPSLFRQMSHSYTPERKRTGGGETTSSLRNIFKRNSITKKGGHQSLQEPLEKKKGQKNKRLGGFEGTGLGVRESRATPASRVPQTEEQKNKDGKKQKRKKRQPEGGGENRKSQNNKTTREPTNTQP